MVLRGVFAAVVCSALLAASPSSADGYKPGEFLSLDLSKAALSPKLLGPPTQFQPVRVEARAEPRSRHVHAQPKAAAKIRVAHVRVEKHHAAARTRLAARAGLAHRHSDPLDAQAFDTRIQVWPCKSGGICNWQR
jgi:hypothetical protein